MHRNQPSTFLFLTLTLFFAFLFMLSAAESSASELNLAMPQFLNVAPDLGIDLYSSGYGPNFVDFDSDGLVDFFFTNHLEPPALFKGQADGSFTNITSSSGIVDARDRHGAAWGDCDDNGLLDLLIAIGYELPDYLYRNNGDNTFTDIAPEVGVADPGRGRGASWIDYNNDGTLDIFVTNANLAGYGDRLYRGEGDCTFTDVSTAAGDITKRFHHYAASWADIDNDGDMDVFAASGGQLSDDSLD